MTDLHSRLVRVAIRLHGDLELQDRIDEAGVADDLTIRNVSQAIGLGISVGQAAITQILTGGGGPLGRKPVEGK